MLATNTYFQSLLDTLDRQIPTVEAALHGSGSPDLADGLRQLWARRRTLRLLMINRRIEAAKSVVNFQRWRDGDGAIYLLEDRRTVGESAPAAERRSR